MRLCQKIQKLRKDAGMSQETLAEKCGVSRQAISKWEADIALPDTEKMILLSELFHVSLDVLMKDEFSVSGVKEIDFCGERLDQYRKGIYEGTLIKESITDESILDYMNVNKVELWKTKAIPKYWTAIRFTSCEEDLPERLSKVMLVDQDTGVSWFVDFKRGNKKYIVFSGEILTYTIGEEEQKQRVIKRCGELGIPEDQMHWSE